LARAGHNELEFYLLAVGADPIRAGTLQFDGVGKACRGDAHTIPAIGKHYTFHDHAGRVSNE
jgi:hypothetical protein